MSRHEGVSCDSCLKGNFRGKRYKCLICYDYDLCATCYEAGSTTTRHTTEHPMQCILTRADYDLYFGNESLTVDQPQSFTCPYCGKLGFTEASLQDHVITEHHDVSFEVVCPICAAVPIGEPNLVTDDFAGHLSLEHRNPSRDLISFLDEPQNRHNVGARRNIPAPSSRSVSSRARRSNMHFSSSGALASISPSSRENVDPIAELLSQLSGVRRNQGSAPSQLQHLQIQLQMERQQAARQQLERMPRRPTGSQQAMAPVGNSPAVINASSLIAHETGSQPPSQFLLSRYFMDNSLTESQREVSDVTRADRALFVRHVLLSSLREGSLENEDNSGRLPTVVLDAVEETPVDVAPNKDETQSVAPTNSDSSIAPPAPNCRPPPRGSTNAPPSTVPPATANAPQIPITQRRKPVPNAIHPETAPSTH